MRAFVLLFLTFLHFCCPGVYAQLPVGGVNTQTEFDYVHSPINKVINPSARLSKNNITKTGGIVINNVAATGNDPSYFEIGAVGTVGYVQFGLRPIKSDEKSGMCEFQGKYFGSEAAKFSARLFSGSTEISSVTLKNTPTNLPSGDWNVLSITAACSSNPVVRLYHDTIGLVIGIRNVYYGPATNLYSVPNGRYWVGSMAVSGCQWSTPTSTLNPINFPVTTGCTYTVDGAVLAPSTMIPGFRLTNVDAGVYEFNIHGSIVKGSSSPGSGLFRIWDGTNYSFPNSVGTNLSGDLAAPALFGAIKYTSPITSGPVTFQMQGWANQNSVVAIINGFKIDVFYTPTTSQTSAVVKADSLDYKPRNYVPTFSGFGTPTIATPSDCSGARKGYELVLECKFTSGTTTSSEARVSLPDGLLTAAGGSGTKLLGPYFRGNNSLPNNYGGGVLYESGVNYVTFSAANIFTNAAGNWNSLAKAGGSSMGGAGDIFSFKVSIPIHGWEPSSGVAVNISVPMINPIRFTAGSGTYQVPKGVKYLKVKVGAGGGGGGGSGTNTNGTGGSGGNSTFGTLVTAIGGSGGPGGASDGGVGGGWTINSPAIYLAGTREGGRGQGASANASGTLASNGSNGGDSCGPGGPGGYYNSNGLPASPTGGGGGGGSGSGFTANARNGTGGGGGGCVYALIPVSEGQTFAWSVGTGGVGGVAGTGGFSAGAGAIGEIVIEEHFSNSNYLLSSDVLKTVPGSVTTESNSKTAFFAGSYSAPGGLGSPCTTTPCTMVTNIGVSSFVKNSSGLYSINVPAGICSEILVCFVMSSAPQITPGGAGIGTSTFSFQTNNASNVATDSWGTFQCSCKRP